MAGRVGVLALQGAFREHVRALADVGLDPVEVRLPAELEPLDGLVIPGGESTTMWKLIDAYELAEPIRALHRRGGAVLGTCAGMIVAARDAVDAAPGQELLDLIDITVRRNAFGRQVASFETPVALRDDAEPMPGVFIRAPWIEATGPGVDVVATVDGRPVAARGGNVLVTAFHPELTEDRRVHREFAEMVAMRRREAA